jgi:nickel-dependent lactate racemase
MVPWLLRELEHVPRSQIVVVNGTGSHRANTPAELRRMLGDEVVDTVRVVNNDAFDKATLTHFGRTSYGGEVWLNNDYCRATIRIATGFVEPHFFAGFSGGPKSVVPAVAGIDTIMHLHNAAMIGHPRSTWGVLDGNPVQGEIREAVALCPPHFNLNVTVDRERRITGVFAGDLLQSHLAGCQFVARTATRPVSCPFDVVVTTNSGYPLDQNLYQTVKGMSAAARIVRPGGAILAVAECADGIPEHGNYKQLLTMRETPGALLELIESPGFSLFDQWQVQTQALVQRRAHVYLYSSLPPDAVRAAQLTPVSDVSAALADLTKRFGPRIAALPRGPMTVPYLVDAAG